MRVRLFAVVLLGALLALAACGGDGDDSSSGATATSSDSATPTSEGSGSGIPSTIDATVGIAPQAGAVGDNVTVQIIASGATDPGIGAWTFNVAYDPAVVSVVECPSEGTFVCNPELDDHTVRFAGATAQGLTGDATLGSITFLCAAAGTSALEITVEVLADATVGDPRTIDAPVTAGEITCS